MNILSIMSEFKTVFICSPAAQSSDTDDYHFKIPRKFIRKYIIKPGKLYELWVREFDEEK